MLRCAIIDDEPLAVSLLESYVSKTPSLELIGSWNDPVEAISRVKELKPDILFLDIQMPGLTGMEILSKTILAINVCNPHIALSFQKNPFIHINITIRPSIILILLN